MADPVTIVGQGIAGSMLGWACERAGIAFEIIDRGHATAASRVGAGLVSPVAGRRLVPTWRFAEWRDESLRLYQELGDALGRSVVREMRLRRIYRDQAERARFEARCAVAEVAQWVAARDATGLWLQGAIQVDTAAIVAALRERWIEAGVLREAAVSPQELLGRSAVIWCVGAETDPAMGPWELAKGEVLTGRLPGLEPDTVLNDGQWIMPMAGDAVRVGATFGRDDLEPRPTERGQRGLAAAARRLTGCEVIEPRGLAGLRVNVPDRRPVVGWLDGERRWGVFTALAAKGALWAPVLAAQWAADGLAGEKIEAEARADRFEAPRN